MNYSVLLCTYNGEKFIREQILSILNQAIVPESIILSDDGSHDETLEVAIEVFREFDFNNFVIIEGPRNGPAQNFLNGMKYNKSDFLLLSDQDDIWELNKVEVISSKSIGLDSNQPTLLFSDSSLIDEFGEQYSASFINYQGLNVDVITDDSLLFKNCVQGATVCLNKALISKVSETTDVSDVAMHDWWLALVASYYGRIIFINKSLIKYRQHSSNEIGARSKRLRFKHFVLDPKFYFRSANKIVTQFFAFVSFCSKQSVNNKTDKLVNISKANNKISLLTGFYQLSLTQCGLIKKIILYIAIFINK